MYEKLKRELANQRITPHGLARKANITPQDLYAALAGKRQMFPGWRKRISKALGVPEGELFVDDPLQRQEVKE